MDRPGNDAAPISRETWLRALALAAYGAHDHGVDAAGPDLGDGPRREELAAYRRGELGAAARNRIEAQLVASRSARQLLVALATSEAAAPSPRVRRAVLAAAAGQSPAAPRRVGLRALRGLALAASLVLAVASGWWWLSHLQGHGPLPDFTVEAHGIATHRGGSEGAVDGAGEPALVRPETELEIFASAERAVRGVEGGLYVLRGGGLERLPPGPRLRVEEERGALQLTARAADLLGAELQPGEHHVWLALGWQGTLPARVELAPGEDPATALRAPDRRVVPVRLRLLAAPPMGENPGPAGPAAEEEP